MVKNFYIGARVRAPEGRALKLITENLWYKLGALALALFVWYYVAAQELQEIVRRVPLVLTIENESLAIVGNPERQLLVTFSIPKNMVKAFSEADVTAERAIDPDGASERYTFSVGAGDVKLPGGNFRVTEIKPRQITVRIDQLSTIKLPLRAQLLGEPAPGYRVVEEEILLDPKEILLRGPVEKLGLFTEALTEPIDTVGRTRSFRKRVLPESYVDIRPVHEVEIEVFIPITEEFGSKAFDRVPVRILGAPFEMILAEVDPAVLTVKVAGPTRLLAELAAEDLLIYVDVTGLKRGEHEISYGYTLPQELAFVDELPKAKVKIGEVKIK